jgi:hypothetical protein
MEQVGRSGGHISYVYTIMQLEFGCYHTINLAWAGCQQDCSLPVNSNPSLPIVSIVQEYATSHVKQEYQGAVLSLLPRQRPFTSQLEKRVQ